MILTAFAEEYFLDKFLVNISFMVIYCDVCFMVMYASVCYSDVFLRFGSCGIFVLEVCQLFNVGTHGLLVVLRITSCSLN